MCLIRPALRLARRLPTLLLIALGALVLIGGRPAFSATPQGACDWTATPQRSSDDQDILIGIRGECATVEIRAIGASPTFSMSAVFVCQAATLPREWWCRLPAMSMGRPTEVRIHGEDPQYDVGWFAEPAVPPPGDTTPPTQVPTAPDGAIMRWRVMQAPVVRWFEFEQTPVDTSVHGSAPATWTPLDAPEAWTYCYAFQPPRFAPVQMFCSRDIPYLGNRYRVRACNWAGCGGWAEEPALACVPLPAPLSTSCPCTVLPSAAGCVYP